MTTIDTNMSLVMIDPNEPLELYDGTIIKGRLEWFLYALCCLDYGNLPTPLSRIEEWANALITNELPNMEPQSRAEEFFKAILTGDTSNLPTPQSRSEVLLDKLARGENDFTNVEKIQSRYEFLLAYLIKNGGGIGNIDYVLYKFQKEDETLYNTKERPVKSAILKGCTLVNISEINRFSFSGGGKKISTSLKMIKSNTDYTRIVYITKNTLTGVNERNAVAQLTGLSEDKPLFAEDNQIALNETGLVYNKCINSGDLSSKLSTSHIRIFSVNTGGVLEGYEIIVEGDYTHQDIPFFTGMQSVKIPVLKATGKNLLGDNKVITGYHNGADVFYNNPNFVTYENPINVIPNTEYIYRNNIQTKYGRVNFYDKNMNIIGSITDSNLSPFVTPNGCRFIRVSTYVNGGIAPSDIMWSQLEQGSTATSYEPYKSNILTVNEDVELRDIKDTKYFNGSSIGKKFTDVLDCINGELKIQTNKITMDGSKQPILSSSKENVAIFKYKPDDLLVEQSFDGGNIFICDKLKFVSALWEKDEEGYCYSNNDGIMFSISNNKFTDINEYLSQNPITFIYPLAQESIKTVDLTITDQGGATIPKLKTFDKITHVNVSATDILPGEVEMEVATTIGEDLSGTLYSTMEDIETKQEALKESNNAQTESINSTMMATTEIYESLL